MKHVTETWKEIDGGNSVSSLGRIAGPRAIRKKCMHRDGYEKVNLSINGKIKTLAVHRLVAAAFLGSPGNRTCVNHINGDKSDNRLENLEWVTYKENTSHALSRGMHPIGSKSGMSKLTESHAKVIREMIHQGYTNREIANEFSVDISTIQKIGKRKAWKHV